MQQPMAQQHDQMGGQQVSQQMVLCPVRFVYETQILVQPGDQIQPNQTFFINPQNPPPWMQNSLQTRQAVSNPVVYVQQLPNNLMSSVQPHLDQNQLYLQHNFANFQLQQQMLAQNQQEMRPTMQIANIVPNIVQNIQNNMTNERQMNQNNQMMQSIQRPMQNQMQNQVEVQRQVYMRPQMQQTNIQRPMMMNQMQNMQQQTMVNMPNIQDQPLNPNMVRPMTNMRPHNIVNVQPVAKIRELPPTDMNKPVNNPIGNVVPTVRNFVPNNYYRPIQPRPQISQMNQNLPKHIPIQTIPNTPMYNNDKQTQQTNNYTIIQQLNTPTVNRKRKSESPDEIQKKMAANVMKSNYPTQNITLTKIVNEIGTNTSPVHRPRITPVDNNTVKILEIKENINKEIPEIDKLVRNTVYPQARGRVLQDKVEDIKPVIEIVAEKSKILEDKLIVPSKPMIEYTKVVNNDAKIVNSDVKMVNNDVKIINTDVKIVNHDVKMIHNDAKIVNSDIKMVNIDAKLVESDVKVVNNERKMDIESSKPINIKEESPKSVQTDNVTAEIISDTSDKSDTADISHNSDKISDDSKKSEVDDEKIKEINRSSIRQENINILTHVVDGYVIQESNFAFPIRKPLKEKTLQTNSKSQKNEKRDLIRESIKEELKNNSDIPLLPFHYLLLDNAKEEKEKEKELAEDENKDNPFAKLQHSTVKSWTVQDLSTHLMKYNWKDTVSLLQDHEIDGETLYLVSKTQLLTIGVAEEHADIICEFVKS